MNHALVPEDAARLADARSHNPMAVWLLPSGNGVTLQESISDALKTDLSVEFWVSEKRSRHEPPEVLLSSSCRQHWNFRLWGRQCVGDLVPDDLNRPVKEELTRKFPIEVAPCHSHNCSWELGPHGGPSVGQAHAAFEQAVTSVFSQLLSTLHHVPAGLSWPRSTVSYSR